MCDFWVEDESRNIGTVFIPDCLYLNMQNTPVIVLIMDVKTRLPRLMKEYSVYPAEALNSLYNEDLQKTWRR